MTNLISKDLRVQLMLETNRRNPDCSELERTYGYCKAYVEGEIAIETNLTKKYSIPKTASYFKKDTQELKIKHFGKCPKHNEHFSIDSFWLGFICSGFTIGIISTIIEHFK